MDLPELLSSPSMWSPGFPAIRVTQERPLESALIVRNSRAEGETGAGRVALVWNYMLQPSARPQGVPVGPQSPCNAPDRGACALRIPLPLGLIMRLIMNLIMRVFGHYEPLETPNLIMIVSLIIRCIMRLLGFQCRVVHH